MAATIPTMPATLWVPERRPSSWPPPWRTGSSVDPVANIEQPDALGAAELVRRQATIRSAAVSANGHGLRDERLDRIGVDEDVCSQAAHGLGDLAKRLDCAGLVVGGHDRYDAGLLGDRRGDVIG